MKSAFFALLAAFSVPLFANAHPASHARTATPPYVTAAINDAARKADKHDDARRQMAAVMTFAKVKQGDKVVELAPGSGYWTRVFSAVVGPKGHVYTIWPDEFAKYSSKSLAQWKKLAATPHYRNVSLLQQPAAQFDVPGSVDLVFTSQNYHDYHNMIDDMAVFNKKVFAALKPGGLFVIIDHVAPAGSGAKDTDTLHRIDPALVKKEVEAVGFEFDGASDALRNPHDPHTATVFDKSIRGHTDQFIYRFRKPAN
ncbi:MAG TPA: methyltransferase domain-containing protein [Gammaproteobacteria bacterium]|nr:methyltransferase domain-containing protein [Gammaproteobacteria bacterium]